MSLDSTQNNVSNIPSIIRTIENDRQVYRWFLMLISIPKIQQALCVEHKTRSQYQTLKKIQITEIVSYMALALTVTVSCFIKQPWLILVGGFPLTILINLFRKNRGCVARISEEFLLKNIQPDQLNRQTLYQTCEYFSQEYNTPSLVDIITFQDTTGRKVLLGAILFLPFIYPFNTWQLLLAILSAFALTLAIVNTSLVLRKLK